MANRVFKLPDIGEGITEAEIAAWRVAVGDTVAEDQPLVDVLTEKAAVEIPSPIAGIVLEVNGKPGDFLAVGSVLVVLQPLADSNSKSEPEQAPARSTPDVVPQHSSPDPGAAKLADTPHKDKALAAPSVRRRARELDIDLVDVPGTGTAGRVTHADLDALTAQTAPAASSAAATRGSGIEEIKIIGLRRKIAEAMQRSSQRIPHFTYVEELDVTELETLRAHLNEARAPEQSKLTILPFLVRALVRAVPSHPEVNALYDDESGIVRRYAALHVGIATQTPNGLVVPVMRDAQTLDLWGIAAAVRRLAEAARNGKAARDELSGSTITITSLGAMGGVASTPVINAPEVAIIGVNRIVERPVIRQGLVVPRQMMNLSCSFDHRIVDGWNAAAFIQQIKVLLEHPATLFM